MVHTSKKGQKLRILIFCTQLIHCLTYLFKGFLLKFLLDLYFIIVIQHFFIIFEKVTVTDMTELIQ